MKRVCIVGAGAIGGFIGARIAASGAASVSALARGKTLDALRESGWQLQTKDELLQVPAIASDSPAALGQQDVIIVAVKGPALPSVACQIAPLLGPQTIVVPTMNGVPWWFAEGIPTFKHARLESVDPGGEIANAIPLQHVVGCVVHASTSTQKPGFVVHKMGYGLIVGEPLGGRSQRVGELAALLSAAGFDATQSENIRQDIWYKLWGNLTMNPVSAVTGATIDQILGDPLLRNFCSRAMEEASAVGARIGCAIDQGPEDRHAITARLGAFKSSMLQDVESGRAIELDSIVTVVHELGLKLGVATPNIDALLGITRVFGRIRGLYKEGTRS